MTTYDPLILDDAMVVQARVRRGELVWWSPARRVSADAPMAAVVEALRKESGATRVLELKLLGAFERAAPLLVAVHVEAAP